MTNLIRALREAGGELRMTGTEFSKTFLFGPAFVGFDGHFPGDPILPAVVQLMAGALALEEAGQRLDNSRWTVNSVSRAKFVKPVRPGVSVCVEGRAEITDTALTGKITLRIAGETASTYILKAQRTA